MIIRSEKNKNYTTISNFALNDNKLSLKAKGLWAFIMTKPDSWSITSRGLASQLKEGRDAVMSAMNELEEAGYLVRGEQRNIDGKFITTESILHENPTTEDPTTEDPTVLVKTNQVTTNQVTTTNVVVANAKVDKRNPDVSTVVESFSSITGLRLVEMTKQRRYASLLLKRESLERVLGACQVVAAVKGDKYAPRITSVEKLYYKWADLELYVAKKQEEMKIIKNEDIGGL